MFNAEQCPACNGKVFMVRHIMETSYRRDWVGNILGGGEPDKYLLRELTCEKCDRVWHPAQCRVPYDQLPTLPNGYGAEPAKVASRALNLQPEPDDE